MSTQLGRETLEQQIKSFKSRPKYQNARAV